MDSLTCEYMEFQLGKESYFSDLTTIFMTVFTVRSFTSCYPEPSTITSRPAILNPAQSLHVLLSRTQHNHFTSCYPEPSAVTSRPAILNPAQSLHFLLSRTQHNHFTSCYPEPSTITSPPAILQVLTIESVVDLGSSMRWGNPTVLGL